MGDAALSAMKYLILVGADFSAESDLALHEALELASNHANAEVQDLEAI